MPTPLITTRDLSKTYELGGFVVQALRGVSLDIYAGEFVAVMGPSGSGKSTLMNLLGCLDTPTSGEYLLAGERISGLDSDALAGIRNRRIGFVFQSYHLINDLTVADNVELPLLYRKMGTGERRKKALAALDRVGLSARTKHFPTQLSGGQCQRVAIARAIVGEPNIILADEPTGNLDSVMSNEILDILLNLNKNERTTIVMVTHNQEMANKTERVIRLFDGAQVA